jgi:hypothetical protein
MRKKSEKNVVYKIVVEKETSNPQVASEGIKPSLTSLLIAVIIGGIVNGIITYHMLSILIPCLFSDLVGGSLTVWSAKKLSKQRGQIGFGTAAIISFLSGVVGVVFLFIYGNFLGMFLGKISNPATSDNAWLVNTIITVLVLTKSIISVVAGVMTANYDKT